jgi:Flp pilus assembly protein TadD
MLENEMLSEQALLMLGDIYALQGDIERAIEVFTPGLDSPSLKKAVAERLVRILMAAGREPEAEFLAKTYLKGCC